MGILRYLDVSRCRLFTYSPTAKKATDIPVVTHIETEAIDASKRNSEQPTHNKLVKEIYQLKARYSKIARYV